jgi:multiple sugar transport system substrate-binding protein
MPWKGFATIACAAVLAAAVGSRSASAADSVTLTFRFNDPEQKEMRAALDEFEKANPGIKVNLERMAWKDARDQFLREAAVGETPDVIHIAFVWAKEMGEAGALLPLDDIAKQAPPGKGLSDFIAMDLATGKDSKIYALPWTVDTWAMVYRRDLLDAAGLKELPHGWAALRAASHEIFAKTGKTGFGFPAGSAASGSLWFLANYHWWSNGKALIVNDSKGFRLGVAKDDVAATMRYFKSYLDEGDTPKSMLGVSDWGDPAIIRGLVDGSISIGIMPPATYREAINAFATANPGKPVPFVSGPVPSGTTVGTSHLGGRMLAVSATTKHPEEAWKLVQFLNSPSIFTGAYKTQFPAQRSLLQSVDFGPEMKGFAEQLTHARPWGAYADGPYAMGSMWNITGRAFGAALSGQRSVDDAAGDMLDQIAKLNAKR